MTGIEIRALHDVENLRDAVRLQQAVWHFSDAELIPLRLFVVATKIGGQVFGAYDGPKMVGFCLAVPGIGREGGQYLHSHMAAVLPDYRNRHIGRALKLAQREDALSRGIGLIEWTFDPLELKNAFFNIERLGAVVRRYVLNQYGITASPLHAGLPTDRCVAEWRLRSPRVEACLSETPQARGDIEGCITVPENIDALRREKPAEARSIQASISEQFQRHLGRGLAVTAFDRPGTYLFSKWLSD